MLDKILEQYQGVIKFEKKGRIWEHYFQKEEKALYELVLSKDLSDLTIIGAQWFSEPQERERIVFSKSLKEPL